MSGGGAGVGVPAERDPEKVRWDVINEFISIEKARDVYRVAIDPVSLTVDEKKTKALRSQSNEK
jgi:N-methylhydantoinase B/oxoprolinase/acetone carboxylase alpha subunit